ncbi:MAG: retropepsin-like aspartic protease, partial [Aestuariibaculum sp.]
MKRVWISAFIVFVLGNIAISQSKFIVQNKKQSDKIRFQFINNVIVVPVEINGVTLSFLLDSGVRKPIIFNFLNISDSLEIKHAETIFLRGLGEGELVEASKSTNNIFKIGDAIKFNQEIYAIYDTKLNFSPKLGVPVHGIIGYDLFKDLIVEINYPKRYIQLTDPEVYRYKNCKKCEIFNLDFHNSKPYINASVRIEDKETPVKLLVDLGSTDSLWLFEDDSLGLKPASQFFRDFLGYGLSGSVYGKRSKVQSFSLKKFKLENVNVAYPDSTSIFLAKLH